jgi:hypothetical protein
MIRLLAVTAAMAAVMAATPVLAQRDCKGRNDNECATNDPFGTKRDLAGRPIRPDGIKEPENVSAAIAPPTADECKSGWTAASKWDEPTFKKACEGK